MKAFKVNDEESIQGKIARRVEVSGEVRFAGVLQVEGKVTGKLISETGTLVIEQTGEVNADVEVGVCLIRGALHGNLDIRSRVEVSKTGRIQGDIKTPVLIVEEGALLKGAVLMGDESAPPRKETGVEQAEPLRKSQIAP
ncbi:MAG TPA: polymer-forming cytoskeletal protein [Blastocatellia bacterium]|nr:polymer-forming cytoskeletal protein [Blastocatellia bacterium]